MHIEPVFTKNINGDTMQSIWQKYINFKKFSELKQNIKTDVLIVGGGITGILCAFELDRRGIDYTLVDAGRICSSVTENTTAKITSQHGLIYNKIETEFNTDFARLYLHANENAIADFKALSEKYKCDLEIKDNYVYSKDDYTKIENELKTLEKITNLAEPANNLNIPVANVGAVKFKNQAQFNPLKLLSQVSQNLNIYENTKVYKIENNIAYCGRYKISADSIIIATHFPIINRYGAYYLKMYQHRSYVIALKGAENVDGMYVDEANDGLSFRNYDSYLLIGGKGHRTGKGSCGWRDLDSFAKSKYPDSIKEYQWATQDCMTLDSIPYIGKYSKHSNNLYVATGFNKWGMTASMAASQILADIVENKRNEYIELFSPSRTILRPQLAVNVGETLVNFCSITPKRCTHLGCALQWNNQEKTWNCPCHGSSYDEKGNILNNPAIKKLNINK